MIGVGLFYRRGYFRQRLDLSGRQQEYWLEPTRSRCRWPASRRPTARRSMLDGRSSSAQPLTFQVWRVDVGRVPLLLLDAELPENDAVAALDDGAPLRRAAAQFGSRSTGCSGSAARGCCEALGIEPAVMHLNEGHPALAALELAAREVGARRLDRGGARDRSRATSSSPRTRRSPAGNETYAPEEFLRCVRRARRPARDRRRGVPRPLPRRSRATASRPG